MTALSRLFSRNAPAIPERASAVIEWWEERRLPYNAVVGATGLVTLGIMNVMFVMPPNPEPMPWQVAVIGAMLWGTAANVCYSAGWALELFIRRWVRDDDGALGSALLRAGFAFSIGLTLVPAFVSVLVWFGRVSGAVL